jgi:SAM-dependent methyltransferase
LDLSELRPGVIRRHPWEIARVRAVTAILRNQAAPIDSIFDVGCGDGFVGESVQASFNASTLVGIDLHLPADRCGLIQPAPGRTIERYQSDALVGDRRFDLVLALDVIEHVPDDVALIRETVRPRLAPNGMALVSVPAFQSLFADHDRALQHYRRYNLRQLRSALTGGGLAVRRTGYMFGTLLLPRLLEKLLESAGRHRTAHGAGAWNGSPASTALIAGMLTLDARLLLLAARAGLPLPGLTAWALCQPR